MINLTRVMKTFVYFGISIAKTSVFINIFIYCNVIKLTVLFNPIISNQISLIAISVDNSGVAGGKRRGRLTSVIIANNSIDKKILRKVHEIFRFGL